MEIAAFWLLFWFPLSVAVAILASRYNRSAGGWLVLSILLSPIIGFAFVLALGPIAARTASAGYQPITEHAPPKAEEAPMSVIEAYSRARADRELRRTARSW